MARLVASRPPTATRRGESPAARLALLEALNACDDLVDGVQRGLDWLAEHAAVSQSACATLDGDGQRLVGVAGYGVAPNRVLGFAVPLDAGGEDTLSAAFASDAIVTWLPGAAPRSAARLFGRTAVAAVPLVAPERGRAGRLGLLLVAIPRRGAAATLTWFAGVFAAALARLHAGRMAQEEDRRLRHERTLLYSIINAVSDPILLTDADGRMIVANTRAELLLGARDEQSEGRRRAVALNNMLFSSALSQTVLEETSPTRRELLLVDPEEGSDLLFEVMSAVTDDAREGTGIVSILRNVSDLRRATQEIEDNYGRLRIAEREVRAERDRLDLVIDSVADPILVTDPAGAIVLMNARGERLFTTRPDAAPEEAQRVSANDAHFSSFVSNLFFSGEDSLRHHGELHLTDPRTGESMPVEAISGKVVSEHGEVTAVVTILHDLREAMEKARLYEALKRASDELEEKVRAATAELVRHNELLRRQHIQLEQASALKSQFLANMSHEFRTPLNAILGYTAMLLQGVSGELAPGQRRSLVRVDSNARHLLSIINDILDISRIEAGKMPLHLGEFDVPTMIAEVLAEVEPIIARSALSVSSALPPHLPLVYSDRQKIKQIVVNLLSNAVKFTPKGSVKIAASDDGPGGLVTIAVADTGIGIAAADREAIFDDFRQADNSTTREYGGAGLGLSICRRLATMVGGQLTVESEVGVGSTFTLTIPVKATP